MAPFIERENSWKRIWRGDYDFRFGHVDIPGDRYKGLEIRKVQLEMEICKSWIYRSRLLMEGGEGTWTKRKHRAED